MQIRRWRITEESGKTVEFTVQPQPPDLIKVQKWEIDMELPTQKHLTDLIGMVNDFMNDNTIAKVEIEEEEVT